MSGPIIDRLDIWLSVNKVDYEKLGAQTLTGEDSETIKNRVTNARIIQEQRFSKNNIGKIFNTEMSAADIEKIVFMKEDARSTLTSSAKLLELSGRAFHRVIKVAQTIADLEKCDVIKKEHILEALQYRRRII